MALHNNKYQSSSDVKKRRPSPLRVEIVKKEYNDSNSSTKEPSTPLSSELYEYSTYCTRYNWIVNKESSNYLPSSPLPFNKSFKNMYINETDESKDTTKMISTNYTKYLIKPRSNKSKFNLSQMKTETNYRTTYRRKMNTTWYTTVHVWSTNSKSPTLSPIRAVTSIERLQDTNMSPRRFSLG